MQSHRRGGSGSGSSGPSSWREDRNERSPRRKPGQKQEEEQEVMREVERLLKENGRQREGWDEIAKLKTKFKLGDQVELGLKMLNAAHLQKLLGSSSLWRLAEVADKDKLVRSSIAHFAPRVDELVQKLEEKEKREEEGKRRSSASGAKQRWESASAPDLSDVNATPLGPRRRSRSQRGGNDKRGSADEEKGRAGEQHHYRGGDHREGRGKGGSKDGGWSSQMVEDTNNRAKGGHGKPEATLLTPQIQPHPRAPVPPGPAGMALTRPAAATLLGGPFATTVSWGNSSGKGAGVAQAPRLPPAGFPAGPPAGFAAGALIPKAGAPISMQAGAAPTMRPPPNMVRPPTVVAGLAALAAQVRPPAKAVRAPGVPPPQPQQPVRAIGGGADLLGALQSVTLAAFFGPLATLGVERPADLSYVTDADLQSMKMTVIQQRKFKDLIKQTQGG